MMGAAPAAAALSAASAAGERARPPARSTSISWPDYFSNDDLAAYRQEVGRHAEHRDLQRQRRAVLEAQQPGGRRLRHRHSVARAGSSSSPTRTCCRSSITRKIDFSALDPSLLNRDYDPGNKYSIPKDWGLLGVVYDPDAVGGEIKTWQDFFDAGAKPDVSGKVRLTKDAGETVGPALWIAGKDWNTATADDIRGTKDFLKGFAKHVKTFSGFDPAALASGAIVLAQANQAAARGAIQQNPKLKWVVPGPHSRDLGRQLCHRRAGRERRPGLRLPQLLPEPRHPGEGDRVSRLSGRHRRACRASSRPTPRTPT